MKKLILFTAVVLCGALHAEGTDDYGVWGEFSVEKDINPKWTAGIDAHFRTKETSTQLDRWGVGVNASYKVHKYLKLGAGVELLNDYTPIKIKNWDGAGWEFDTEDGIAERKAGYRKTESYFTPKWRLKFEVSSGVKIAKWVKISARVRYRYARVGSVSALRTKFRKTDSYNAVSLQDWQWALSEAGGWTSELTDPKEKDAYSNHQLRSRVKIEMDRKRVKWHPFVSGEVFNDLSDGGNMYKIRLAAGCGYDINKHHNITLAYVLTMHERETEADFGKRMHATSVNYNIKF